MNICQKVQQQLKYCGNYHGHAYMMDERTGETEFNVTLAEEHEIRDNINILKFVLLTGEAGDGKSRILRNLNSLLQENHFIVCQDYSAIGEVEKKNLINSIYNIIMGKCDEKIIVAANIGIFTKTVLKHKRELLQELNRPTKGVKLINFEKRNLAYNKDVFYKIVRDFLKYDSEVDMSSSCPYNIDCMYKTNIDYLLTDCGCESLRVLVDSICLMGGHVTIRELLSLISYIVTFGHPCAQRNGAVDHDKYHYSELFNETEDLLLRKISILDPAQKRGITVKAKDLGECIKIKRSRFFTEEGDKYSLLFADYLADFRNVIDYINNTEPYYFDTERDKNKILYRLKRGLSKITKKGQTDVSMTIGDTPTMFDDNIQTEFTLDTIETVWNRYDVDFNDLESKPNMDNEYNKFYLSYIYNQSDKSGVQSINMLIDYKLFCYLLRADEDYFLHRSSLSIEEYSINNFYRNILKTKPEAYHRIHVKLVKLNKEEQMNFQLEIKEKSNILFNARNIIKIRGEV